MQRSSSTYNDEKRSQLEARAYKTDRCDTKRDDASSDKKTCSGRHFVPGNELVVLSFHDQVDSNSKNNRSNNLKGRVVFSGCVRKIWILLTENSILKMMNVTWTMVAPAESLPAIVATTVQEDLRSTYNRLYDQ